MTITLQQIADYYTRLRLAGMPENEIKIFKQTLVQTSLINNIDILTLLSDSVSYYEELQAKTSLLKESEFTKGMLEVS